MRKYQLIGVRGYFAEVHEYTIGFYRYRWMAKLRGWLHIKIRPTRAAYIVKGD